MKIRSDSLYAQLDRLGLVDEFLDFVSADSPSYVDMRAWLSGRGLSPSNGALHNLITYHMAQWRVRRAKEAVAHELETLPADVDSVIKQRYLAMRFDLALRDLDAKTAVTLLKLELAERELAAKNQTARDAGVQALMDEAKGNAAAEAALAAFLAALDAARPSAHSASASPRDNIPTDQPPAA